MSLHQAVHQLVNDQVVAPAGHVTAAGFITASLVGYLTPTVTLIGGLLMIAWYAVTLYETKTVQDIIARFKASRAKGMKQAATDKAASNLVDAKAAVVEAKAAVLADSKKA